jgi:hypothetical protein
MNTPNNVVYIISDLQKCISDITECHERVMSSFNQSIGNYYENAHTMMRYPNNNHNYENRVSMHYEQMQFHNQIISRSLSIVENAMNQIVLNNGNRGVRARTSSQRPADISGGRSQTSRTTDNLIQEMMASILSPTPPQPQRLTRLSTTPPPSLYSLFSNGFGPSLGTGLYGFDATIQIEPAENLTSAEVEQYTELVEYHVNNTDMTETRCPITYEDFVEGEQVRRIRYCRHYFKDSAITGWLRNTRGSCPVCRHILHDAD